MRNNGPINHFPPTLFSPIGSRIYGEAHSEMKTEHMIVWVHSPKATTQPSPGVVISEELNDQALATLNAGGKVLLLLPPSRVKGDPSAKVELGFFREAK
jgi:hypothetical protein